MKPYKYSPADYQTAKYILENQGLDRFGKPLYPPTFITWACKVYQWWQRFHQVMKRYARIMGNLALATKAVWLNISRGISLPKMLRQLANPVGVDGHIERVKDDHGNRLQATGVKRTAEEAASNWQKPRFPREDTKRNGPAITYIRPKTNKHERRMKCTNIANRLQSC